MSTPTVSYAIAAGSKVSKSPLTESESLNKPIEEAKSESSASDDEQEQESKSSKSEIDAKNKPKSSKQSKTKAEQAVKLAPAPVPVVSAWGKSTTITKADHSLDQSPLAESLKVTEQKKPVAKVTGKEKWVPYAASVVLSSSKPAAKPKRNNPKKKTAPKPKPHRATVEKKEVPEVKQKPKKESEPEALDTQTTNPAAIHEDQPKNNHYSKPRFARGGHSSFNGHSSFRGGRGGKQHYYNSNSNGNYHNNKQQRMQYVPPFVPQQMPQPISPQVPFVPYYPAFGQDQPQQFYPAPVYFTPKPIPTLAGQISYYFSTDNLEKDTFLRRQMNSEGWIPIKVIANFYRVQNLSGGNYYTVVEAMKQIEIIEVKGDKARLANGHEKYVLPLEERDENGKDEGSVVDLELSEKVANLEVS